MKSDYDMIFVAGPTASGKSGLGLALAECLNGAIVNADSMQVYADMPIITATPNAEEQNRVPHYLFGHIDSNHRYSQAQWLDDASNAVAAIRANGQIPILVGGTGLYFKAATTGIVPMPEIPAEIKAKVMTMLDTYGSHELHIQLAKVDPDLAQRLEPADSQRIIRGMEIWLASLKPLSEWQRGEAMGKLDGKPFSIYLRPPRDMLYDRINIRFEQMVANGVINEISDLKARQLDASLPAMKAVGVRPILEMLDRQIDDAMAMILSQRDTRRYAKRQFTWFDHQYDADLIIDTFPEGSKKGDVLNAILSNFQKGFI